MKFVATSDHKEFVAALAQAVKDIEELTFEPPLDNESDQILVKGLTEVRQIVDDIVTVQEQQLHDLTVIMSELDDANDFIRAICKPNIFHIRERGKALGAVVSLVEKITDVAEGVLGYGEAYGSY